MSGGSWTNCQKRQIFVPPLRILRQGNENQVYWTALGILQVNFLRNQLFQNIWIFPTRHLNRKLTFWNWKRTCDRGKDGFISDSFSLWFHHPKYHNPEPLDGNLGKTFWVMDPVEWCHVRVFKFITWLKLKNLAWHHIDFSPNFLFSNVNENLIPEKNGGNLELLEMLLLLYIKNFGF